MSRQRSLCGVYTSTHIEYRNTVTLDASSIIEYIVTLGLQDRTSPHRI